MGRELVIPLLDTCIVRLSPRGKSEGSGNLYVPVRRCLAHSSGEICVSSSSIFLVTFGFSFSSSTKPGESIPAGMKIWTEILCSSISERSASASPESEVVRSWPIGGSRQGGGKGRTSESVFARRVIGVAHETGVSEEGRYEDDPALDFLRDHPLHRCLRVFSESHTEFV